MPNGTATCFTRMPHDLVESIAHCAAKEDRSMSSILRVLVREALEARISAQGTEPCVELRRSQATPICSL
jgi:hypothetical protein